MDEIGLSDFFNMLHRRRRMIAAVTAIALAIAVAYLVVTPKTYRGKVTVLLQRDQTSPGAGIMSQLSGIPGVGGGLAAGLMSEPAMYAEILRSRTLAERVIGDLQLAPAGIEASDLQELVQVDTSKDSSMKVSCYAPTNWVADGKIGWLHNKYPDESAARLTARLAAAIANTYVDELRTYDRTHALTSGRRNTIFLREEVKKTRGQLAKSEESLRKFQADHPTLPPPGTGAEQMKEIVDLRSAQMETESQLRETARSADEAKGLAADEEVVQSAAKVIEENPVITELKNELAKSEVERARMLENMTDKHPDVIEKDQEIAKTRERIHQEVARVTKSETLQLNPIRQSIVEKLAELEVKKSGLEARAKAMNQIMAKTEAGISRQATDEMRYVRLLRDVKAFEMVYTSLVTQLSDAKIKEAKNPEEFTILDPAMPEKKHFKPKAKLTLVAAVVLGLMAGCFIAAVQEAVSPVKRVAERSREVEPIA